MREGERGDVGAARPLGAAARAVGAPLGLVLGEPGGRARARAARSAACSPAPRSPRWSGSTGTSRQPSGSRPSARQASSIAARAVSSRRKTIARPAPGFRTQRVGKRQQETGAVPGPAVARDRARDGAPGTGPRAARRRSRERRARRRRRRTRSRRRRARAAGRGGWSRGHNLGLSSRLRVAEALPSLSCYPASARLEASGSASSDPRAALRRRAGRAVVHAGHR